MGEVLETEAENNLGMVVIFTLVSAANEWLNNEWDSELKRIEDEAEQKIPEAEEAEKNKFHGTPVSIENFLAWKMKFDAEMILLKKPEKEDKDKKLTGRELFLVDKSLVARILSFLKMEEKPSELMNHCFKIWMILTLMIKELNLMKVINKQLSIAELKLFNYNH